MPHRSSQHAKKRSKVARLASVTMICVGWAAATGTYLGSTTSRLQAQSLQQFYNQTKRGISKTIRATQSVIDGKSNGNRRRKAIDPSQSEEVGIVIPPLPERKPRPWAKKQKTQPLKTVPVRRADKPAKRPAEVRASPKKTSTKTAPSLTATPKHSDRNKRPEFRATRKAADATSKPAKDDGTTKGADQVADEEPDVYTDVEINIAKARCRYLLKQVDAVTLPHEPIKKGPCGNPAPVKLVSVGAKPQVSLSPPAVINCDMVAALHKWLENDLQPLARKHLGAPIIRLNIMSAYSCRNAYGRRDTRLSEHAKANALDIGGFVTAKAQTADLLKHWGPTQRDIAKRLAEEKAKAAAEKAAAKKAAEEAKKLAAATPAKGNVRKISVRSTIHDGLPEKQHSDDTNVASRARAGSSKLGASPPLPTPKALIKKVAAKSKPAFKPTGRSRFLRAAHKRACKLFGTTLGPEANNAHRNHFHIDLAPRKRSKFCE